jgi:ParB family chromosome partitioning protein
LKLPRCVCVGKKERRGLSGGLDAAVEAMKRIPWTTLAELKGDRDVLKKIDDAEALFRTLRKTLSD